MKLLTLLQTDHQKKNMENLNISNQKTMKLSTGTTYKFLVNDDLNMTVKAVFQEIEINENSIKYVFQIDGNNYKLTEGILRKYVKLPMK